MAGGVDDEGLYEIIRDITHEFLSGGLHISITCKRINIEVPRPASRTSTQVHTTLYTTPHRAIEQFTPTFNPKREINKAQKMASYHYTDETPAEVKNAKGLHLITQNTPNGQAVQIFLEELKDAYGTEFTTSVIDISTNVQKSDWFLRLDPNGRIPVLVDNTQTPPFSVHETSAELFYLLKFADKEDKFGFTSDLERNQALQWTFFWHGSGAPYQGQTNHFLRAAPEKIEYAITRFRNEYVSSMFPVTLP